MKISKQSASKGRIKLTPIESEPQLKIKLSQIENTQLEKTK